MKASVATFLSASIFAACPSYSSCFVASTLPARWTAATATARSTQTAPAAHREAGSRRRFVGALSAEPADDKSEEQEPMDLDLEQMFEVFEAADKEVSDASVGKKGGKKPRKDAGEAMGDMLSNFFGGGKK
eukprot:jgi/Undpi1/12008/HiC_scaffold_4.g01707.m1